MTDFLLIIGFLVLPLFFFFIFLSSLVLKQKKLGVMDRLVAGIPVYLLVVFISHLNQDAGEARTYVFDALNSEFVGFSEKKLGTSEDGLSMLEYWANKDLIDEYSDRLMHELAATK